MPTSGRAPDSPHFNPLPNTQTIDLNVIAVLLKKLGEALLPLALLSHPPPARATAAATDNPTPTPLPHVSPTPSAHHHHYSTCPCYVPSGQSGTLRSRQNESGPPPLPRYSSHPSASVGRGAGISYKRPRRPSPDTPSPNKVTPPRRATSSRHRRASSHSPLDTPTAPWTTDTDASSDVTSTTYRGFSQ